MTPLDRALAWLFGLALLVTHHDFWRGARPEIWFGLPEEILRRVVWMLACAAYLVFFTTRVWRREAPPK